MSELAGRVVRSARCVPYAPPVNASKRLMRRFATMVRERRVRPLTARRSRGRRRCSRDPYPDVGNRYAITLQVVAAAGVADFPLYRGCHGDLRLRLVDGRGCVDRVTGVRRVWIGIVRIRER